MTSARRRRLVALGTWRRPTRGVFDTGVTVPGLHPYDLRRLRSAWLALLAYPGAAAVGSCALALLGVAGLPPDIAPEAAFPHRSGRAPRDGVLLRQYRRFPCVVVGDHRVAEPAHALAQALPGLDREHGVSVMDSLLNRRLLTPAGLVRARRLTSNRPGCAATHPWWDLADGRAESPVETAARLRCVDAGIPPDELQHVVRDDSGRFLGRADLAWRLGDGRWLLVEIDSDTFHTSPEQVRRDAVRQNALLREGKHILLRFFPRDLPTMTPQIQQTLAGRPASG